MYRFFACFALAMTGLISSGCGETSETTIVGGPDERYQMPADAQAKYAESMAQQRGSGDR